MWPETDLAARERAQHESEGGKDVDDQKTEHDEQDDIVVGMQHELPVSAIAVQLMVQLFPLLFLVLPGRPHP